MPTTSELIQISYKIQKGEKFYPDFVLTYAP